ncbi:hypothetical protein CAter282_3521 [Collimonas arenae]|uniref:Uncharacterized protein n=1 Tax=Collimonas arenae TaxID=279058 RepID=A0A127PUB5_9BURK|nr:hypothetical protein CAter10_3855 [Collimonas arenae]AMP11207.1 hypothetical protein CAter282_3521 [Collimonas arenae]
MPAILSIARRRVSRLTADMDMSACTKTPPLYGPQRFAAIAACSE